jgi:hypothetical protein
MQCHRKSCFAPRCRDQTNGMENTRTRVSSTPSSAPGYVRLPRTPLLLVHHMNYRFIVDESACTPVFECVSDDGMDERLVAVRVSLPEYGSVLTSDARPLTFYQTEAAWKAHDEGATVCPMNFGTGAPVGGHNATVIIAFGKRAIPTSRVKFVIKRVEDGEFRVGGRSLNRNVHKVSTYKEITLLAHAEAVPLKLSTSFSSLPDVDGFDDGRERSLSPPLRWASST